MIEILKAILYGIVEGITEWLPISSTGHMILLNEFVKLNVSEEFWNMFLVVIQLGAILAVVVLNWGVIWPLRLVRSQNGTRIGWKKNTLLLWAKTIVACIPAGVVGVLFDDWIDAHFYNWICVSVMLIVVGIAFLIIENRNRGVRPRVRRLKDLTFKDALIIGMFQLLAAVFPGTSRSGSTILGGIMIGVSRTVASRFTFILAIPVMAGASLLKLLKYGLHWTPVEYAVLATGMIVAFAVSILVISFLMEYIRKHDFRIFGWYRIVLGVLVILYFFVIRGV
ncbi:MAG: undecaprenyl-diphosphate phosphatase [Lachnospiraceae bacterium]|nr:undecaprenyl-diphosphate phosphatase [Lachnospiraceae bacterium]